MHDVNLDNIKGNHVINTNITRKGARWAQPPPGGGRQWPSTPAVGSRDVIDYSIRNMTFPIGGPLEQSLHLQPFSITLSPPIC